MTIANDAFSDLDPPLDDSGFTTDLGVAFWRPWGEYRVGGALFDRWITEVGGPRRWDHLDLVATLARRWPHLEASARLGPTLGGNLGGRWTQDAWHSVTRSGPTLDQGLQHIYPAGTTIGVLAGARGEARASLRWLEGYTALDGQLALSGVSFVELAGGGRAVGRARDVELGAHVEVAVARYRVGEPALALPGGYGPGAWQVAVRAGVHVAWSRFRIEYEYRANEGGSGEPIGVLAISVAQAK